MHPYATDSAEREKIPLYIAGLAIVSALGLSWVLQHIHWPGWLDAPATAGFYGLYYQLFRHYLWKLELLHRWGWVRVPNIAGAWDGYVVTSFDEQKGKHRISAQVQQNWTHLRVTVSTDYSRSSSIVGSILIGADVVLDYEYRNEPLPTATQTMHAHRGTASLRFDDNAGVLEGEYYSGRDRLNYGAIRLEKIEETGTLLLEEAGPNS
jgi:hypothetical protein